uniref:BMP family lipoprotein n=1 Tax=Pararhizobium sp. IMCC3301 TaxID=3067904 RepID=UPI002740B818|nr:BMP family ABC transporter substrate-binding protein [Pararhizobium sp. IMCC3301]
MKLKLFATLAAAAMMATTAFAQEFKPALIFDMGGKFDKSFNEAAYNGAEKFKADTGIEYGEFEITNASQREQALRNFARRGYNPIVVMGFTQAEAMNKVSAEFPDLKFAIIDEVVDQPNVRSVVFKAHEGSFLVGLLAGMKSQTGTVGFVGGMDIPLIRNFACGYVQGVKAANPDAKIIQNMTGETPAAWNDPVKGAEITKAQIDAGADVVYAAAGGTGVGVLQKAADEGKFSIGVDSNQNYMHPGSILTSMLKRVDVAVYDAFMDGKNNDFATGFVAVGLEEDGVGWALDENNESLITEEMKQAVDQARADIIAGKVAVHDYNTSDSCPVM